MVAESRPKTRAPAGFAGALTEKEGFEPSRQTFIHPNALAGRRLQPLGHFSGAGKTISHRSFGVLPRIPLSREGGHARRTVKICMPVPPPCRHPHLKPAAALLRRAYPLLGPYLTIELRDHAGGAVAGHGAVERVGAGGERHGELRVRPGVMQRRLRAWTRPRLERRGRAGSCRRSRPTNVTLPAGTVAGASRRS